MTPDRGSILVTPRSLTKDGADSPYFDPLRAAGYAVVTCAPGRTPTTDELRDLLPGVVGWLAGVEPITSYVLDAADRLRVISRNGTGTDSIDVDAVAARGIAVERALGANAQGVAELAVALALSAQRGVPWSSTSVKTGGWERDLGRELSDTTVGVVGLGAIGARVAQLFSALGTTVKGYDPYVEDAPYSVATIEDVFTAADIVSLHVPAPSDGGPLVTPALLGLIRRGAVLVNTARSALVDDAVTLRALEDGVLGAYAVDAYDTEPPVLTDLLRHPRTIATAHIGGYTAASVHRATTTAVTNLLDALDSLARREGTP